VVQSGAMRVVRSNRLYAVALWVDRYVGSTLCALLLGAKKLFRGRREPLPAEDVRKVLLLKMWGMGSIVLVSPLFEAVRARHPGARVDFLSLAENRAIVEMYPGVDRAIAIDLRRGILGFLVATVRTIWAIRRERYDLLLDLEFFTRFSAIFSFLANPRRSHGFSAKGKWRGRLHDVEVPFNAYNHVALNFLDLLRGDPMDPVDAAAVSGPDSLPRLDAPGGAWESCRDLLARQCEWRAGQPIVVVNPNAGDMALERRWPREQVAELLRSLALREDLNVVVTGSPGEREYVESVVRAVGGGGRVVNLAGRIDVAQLVALLAHAAVVVTNDSGPLHIAAAAGASTVALFGPETPVLYGPLRSRDDQAHVVHYRKLACSPCMFVHDNKVLSCWFAQARCMTGIRASDVLASVDAVLAGSVGDSARPPQLRVIDR
jgi:lipopolysaccharide heptosyltransferase II